MLVLSVLEHVPEVSGYLGYSLKTVCNVLERCTQRQNREDSAFMYLSRALKNASAVLQANGACEDDVAKAVRTRR